jgi:hypothetical protein
MSKSPSMTAPVVGNTSGGSFTPAAPGAEMPQRRKLLLAATSAVGAVGAAAAGAPSAAHPHGIPAGALIGQQQPQSAAAAAAAAAAYHQQQQVFRQQQLL